MCQNLDGPWYAEWDDEYEWCVFNESTGFCTLTCATQQEAEAKAAQLNAE